MLAGMNRLLTVAALLAAAPWALAADEAPRTAPHSMETPRIFEGYDAFYATLPSRLFTAQEARTLTPRGIGTVAGDAWTWHLDGRTHVLSLRGADIALDGRRLPAARATRFQGEDVAPALGRSATVYAGGDSVCVEGVPSSASGTAVRHVRVSLITQAYGAKARRFELPSLFASCMGLTREANGIGFFQASYRWPTDAPAPLGLTLVPWRLTGTRFVPAGPPQITTFVEPGNLYRFTAP